MIKLALAEFWSVSRCSLAVLTSAHRSFYRYTPAFSERLAKALCALVSGHERIAFLCAPSAYVGTRYHLAQHPDSPARDVSLHLFECDSRFATFARDDFVRYDLDEPLVLPEELVGQIDIAIVDPPFLNRVRPPPSQSYIR